MFDSVKYADGIYTLQDPTQTGNSRVWTKTENNVTMYLQWSAVENNWVLSDCSSDPANGGIPYFYATTVGDNPWDCTWDFTILPISITVTH